MKIKFIFQIGLVPQRIGILRYVVNNGINNSSVASSGGFQFTVSTINPATWADANPGLRFNTSGQVVSTYTGDASYFQNLQTYYTTNALSRQAVAPLWEVDTARLQDKAHLSNSGLSELERAANLGRLTMTKPVPTAGTTQRWNPIALNLGGGLKKLRHYKTRSCSCAYYLGYKAKHSQKHQKASQNRPAR